MPVKKIMNATFFNASSQKQEQALRNPPFKGVTPNVVIKDGFKNLKISPKTLHGRKLTQILNPQIPERKK
jgi:hypothetical protein